MHSDHLIVTGCPRTGTSTLCKLLSKDPRILVTNEANTYFNWKNPIGSFLSDLLSNPQGVTYGLLKSNDISPEELAELAAERNMSGEQFYELLKERSRKPIVGDKVPVGYLIKLNELSKAFPQAKFLITLRDGRDVVASQIRHFRNSAVRQHWHRADIEQAQGMWLGLTKILLNQVLLVAPDRFFILRYEYLVDETDDALAALSEFLGLDDPIKNRNIFKSVHTGVWKKEHPDMMTRLSAEFKTYLTLLGYK
jgi:hypothetical protein